MMAFNCCLLVAQMSNLRFILLKRKKKTKSVSSRFVLTSEVF